MADLMIQQLQPANPGPLADETLFAVVQGMPGTPETVYASILDVGSYVVNNADLLAAISSNSTFLQDVAANADFATELVANTTLLTGLTAGLLETRTPDLDVAATLTDNDEIEIYQPGNIFGQRNRRVTLPTLSTYFGAGGGGSGTELGWFNVLDYGATGDGTTDDTVAIQAAIDAAAAAGGGVIYFPSSVYVVGGALQDVSRGNAQLLLPAISTPDEEPITLVFKGEYPPPPNFSVIGDTPTPNNQSVIKSTLASGTGACIGGWGPALSFNDNTRVHCIFEDLTVRVVVNPTITGIDGSHVATMRLNNVIVDAGDYWIQGIAEPTTTTSYGIRMPRNGNGADLAIGTTNVVGFYNGYQFGEHTNGYQVNAWGCKKAYEFIAADHASHFTRMMAVHCEKVLTATGTHYVEIEQLNLEHSTSGWWTTDQDIDDPNNYLIGRLRWHVVEAGTGVDDTFTVNGALNMEYARVGQPFTARLITETGNRSMTRVDIGKYLRFTSATAKNYTVRDNADIYAEIGSEIHGRNANTEALTIIEDTAVTVNPPAGGTLAIPEGGSFTLKKVATDTWDLIGVTEAAP